MISTTMSRTRHAAIEQFVESSSSRRMISAQQAF
jgi:hypothetical protein